MPQWRSDLKEQTRKVLATLTPREEQVLRMRFGIGDRLRPHARRSRSTVCRHARTYPADRGQSSAQTAQSRAGQNPRDFQRRLIHRPSRASPRPRIARPTSFSDSRFALPAFSCRTRFVGVTGRRRECLTGGVGCGVVWRSGLMETSLERDLRQWRENRAREADTMASLSSQLFEKSASAKPSAWQAPGGRRVRVKGQDVVVVAKRKRPLSS